MLPTTYLLPVDPYEEIERGIAPVDYPKVAVFDERALQGGREKRVRD